MITIIGLGNPEPCYHGTRHNIGYRVLGELATGQPGSWRRLGSAEVLEIRIGAVPVLLVKPQAGMNNSGAVLAELAGLRPDRLLVVHDEVDFPLGVVRIKSGGTCSRHNGVRSIEERLGSTGFSRVRVGIGRPGAAGLLEHVLGQFTPGEASAVADALAAAGAIVAATVQTLDRRK